MGRMRAVPRLCELYPGICLTTEEKARKYLSQGNVFFQKLGTDYPVPRRRITEKRRSPLIKNRRVV